MIIRTKVYTSSSQQKVLVVTERKCSFLGIKYWKISTMDMRTMEQHRLITQFSEDFENAILFGKPTLNKL